jgi:mono/diheme cytochrome c family protein
MTEVPEHLLRRARERRAALSGGEGGAAPDAAGGGQAPPPAEASATPATTGEPAAGVPAVPAAAIVPEPVVELHPSYIAEQAVRRTRLPVWIVPVLFLLPFWGVLYTGAFGDRTKHVVVDPLVLGQEVYARAGCSSCHGAQGQGGVGPALQNGDAAKTFPVEADHISWVKTGSGPFTGKPYGDPARGRIATGTMPAFQGQLTEEEIAAVVKFEREKL